jgi:4-amino-4-deoxy-L-arabinose transferase-like glycosyltransferase
MQRAATTMPPGPGGRSGAAADRTFLGLRFGPALGLATLLALAVRLAYVLTDDRTVVGGDGYWYHVVGLRLADGHGYTFAFGGPSRLFSAHPPAWATLLAVFSWLGARSQLEHQLVGVGVGLAIVVVTGLVGRRYFDSRVGVVAAALAAVYPGFWVLEGNLLSEPLAILVLGLLTLALAEVRDHHTAAWSLLAGLLCGLLTLVRSEALALLIVMVAPVVLLTRSITLGRRLRLLAVAALACFVVVAPWVIYLSTYYDRPVFLSTNAGYLALASNCPPLTYEGKFLGYEDTRCPLQFALHHLGETRAEVDARSLQQARRNLTDNLDRLPVVTAARVGRLLAVFRPAQTVGFAAGWMTTSEWPVWAWVASYWVLLPLACVGFVFARRAGALLLPLVAPMGLALVQAILSFGDPRYHAAADLGVLVLAAVAVVRLVTHRRLAAPSGSRSELLTRST